MNHQNCNTEILDTEREAASNKCVESEIICSEIVGKAKRKKTIWIIVGALTLLLALLLVYFFSSNSIERTAQQYVRKTLQRENVKTINGVACISKKYYNDTENTYGYIVLFQTPYGSDFAYYENNLYKGNGKNGGDENSSFHNLHALFALEQTIDYLMKENPALVSGKTHIEAEEGVVYIQITDFSDWLDRY